jgi:hypothetical protein
VSVDGIFCTIIQISALLMLNAATQTAIRHAVASSLSDTIICGSYCRAFSGLYVVANTLLVLHPLCVMAPGRSAR